MKLAGGARAALLGLALLSLGGAEAAQAATARAADPQTRIVWVRFVDRGALEKATPVERRRAALANLSPRSLERRARRGLVSGPLESDLPVDAGYVERLEAAGFTVRGVSRWLNAASVAAPATRLGELARLPFVASVTPVPRFRLPEPGGDLEWPRPFETVGSATRIQPLAEPIPGEPGFYGFTASQNRIVQADRLHARGLSGRGILVAILDTGFRETHLAFDSLDVLARRDFIHHDDVVANEAGQDVSFQESHGTETLSILAGYEPGIFVGAAFHATVALAKTEEATTELPAEMDRWQLAAEWADSLGADVISSSLGYSTFDDPESSYTYADMDGRTTVVTLAAEEAARRGITVVTAVGNEGQTPWHYLLAPADAPDACAVGAVDSLGGIVAFSSFGPTSDGRVKPDVCAQGRGVAVVPPSTDTLFVHGSGTSFATPEIAGVAALLLEAHPLWGPRQVLEALRATAAGFAHPDDQYGYGLARAEDAWAWNPSAAAANDSVGRVLVLLGPNPVPPGGAVSFELRMGKEGGHATVDVIDAAGRRVRNLLSRALDGGETRLGAWDGADERGRRVSAGLYWIRFDAPGLRGARRVVVL